MRPTIYVVQHEEDALVWRVALCGSIVSLLVCLAVVSLCQLRNQTMGSSDRRKVGWLGGLVSAGLQIVFAGRVVKGWYIG